MKFLSVMSLLAAASLSFAQTKEPTKRAPMNGKNSADKAIVKKVVVVQKSEIALLSAQKRLFDKNKDIGTASHWDMMINDHKKLLSDASALYQQMGGNPGSLRPMGRPYLSAPRNMVKYTLNQHIKVLADVKMMQQRAKSQDVKNLLQKGAEGTKSHIAMIRQIYGGYSHGKPKMMKKM